MGDLTASVPKPLLELDHRTLIERQLERIAAAGIATVIINLSYRGDRIRSVVGDGSRFGVEVLYSEEGPEPLETAGGIVQALSLLGDEPFLVVNADVVSDFNFGALAIERGLGDLVLVPNPAHKSDGDYGVDASRVLSHDRPHWTFAGISLLSPTLFAHLAPGRRPLSQVFERAIADRALTGRVHHGLWIDVGTPERLELARRSV